MSPWGDVLLNEAAARFDGHWPTYVSNTRLEPRTEAALTERRGSAHARSKTCRFQLIENTKFEFGLAHGDLPTS